MKVYLVKNDEFKTVGIEVEENGCRLFNHGISRHPYVWVKQVDFETNAGIIFQLIAIKREIAIREKYISEWFETAKQNNVKHEGINFSSTDEKIAQLNRELERLIEKVK